ncbi:3'-5' exonuclease [Methanomethylophilus alvi]|uniref:3'-5' exonuclease n=1 Tax=Methanomethylophilus alvi TaxID=1291540 RepID=UPI0037DDC85F
MVLIIDTETTGLSGYPKDRVLEIGIAELEGGSVRPVYSEIIRYPDIAEFDRKYVNLDGSEGIWIYRNTDLRMEDTLNASKDVERVAAEVRAIVSGMEVTSYNVPFDLGKFLYHEPWNLRGIVERKIDIMKLATSKVYELCESDSLDDKGLQERLLREREESYYPEKWVRSIDAYRALCPEDPMGLEGMRHRAIDDAVMEGWILKALQINNADFLG